MGDVYEAEDLHLRRRLALKFLSSTYTDSPQAVQRFEREALSASALNHAHICTIYDIGEHHGEHFIAMELLEGETLRDRLRRGSFDASTLLDLAIQVADALAAAHRAHVVHRDVSPSNIFITREGTAKLVDFGLAKPEPGSEPSTLDADVSTTELELTGRGVVVGTPAYMSPEQVRGDEVDHRTDTFSFGAVLYEMATGRRPFTGKTAALIYDGILHATPEPVSAVNAAMPPGLQDIIDKALEKDRHLRYQSLEELRTDLERVRRDMQGPDREPHAEPRRVRAWMVLLVVAVLLMGGIAADLVRRAMAASVPKFVARQVTSAIGVEDDPAIAPDGKTIAYTSDESGNKDIWIVDVHGGPARRLTSHPASDTHASWFPDGRAIAFASARNGRTDIWRASPQDGDAATLLVADADAPAVSPDGTRIAFVRRNADGSTRLTVAPVSDPSRAYALSGDRDGRWDHKDPAWSPDGTLLCYSAWDGLWVVAAAGGTPHRLTFEESDGHPSWSADGRYVYFESYRDAVPTLWRVSVTAGVPERVSPGSGTGLAPDLSREGHLLSFSSSVSDVDLVSVDLATGWTRQFGTGGNDLFPTLGPRGDVVYFQSDRWGAADIWSQPLLDREPTGPPVRVFEQAGAKSAPDCSPDGQWLAYYQIVNERRDVWVVATSHGTPVRITTDGNSFHPSWSPDSTTIAYVSEGKGVHQLWTQRIVEGQPAGAPTKIAARPGSLYFPVWSPDGSRIALITGGPSRSDDVAIVPSTGGPLHFITSDASASRVRWNRQSGVLLVSGLWGKAEYELRSMHADGTPASTVAASALVGADEGGAVFDLSQDGQFVVASRGRRVGHVWVWKRNPAHSERSTT